MNRTERTYIVAVLLPIAAYILFTMPQDWIAVIWMLLWMFGVIGGNSPDPWLLVPFGWLIWMAYTSALLWAAFLALRWIFRAEEDGA